MTDPVTNVEIEDVLSSIRRLVSENARAERAPETAESRAQNRDVEPEEQARARNEAEPDADAHIHTQEDHTLVLTPALRVAEAEAQAAGEAPALEDESGGDADEADDLKALIDTLAEETADDTAGDQPDAAAQEALGRLSFSHSEEAAHGSEMSTLETRIAGLEAAVAQREDNWEPDGTGDDDNAGAPVESLNWEDSDVAASRWDAGEDVEEAELISDLGEASAMDLSEFADTDIETGAQAEPRAAAEPEIAVQVVAETAEEADDDAQDAAMPEAADPQLSQGMEPDPDLFGDESVIDEEMLRDMVAEIVRQELQGSLGERITRNVRKLVRREIHRALAARELD